MKQTSVTPNSDIIESTDEYGTVWTNKKGTIIRRTVNGFSFQVAKAKTEDYVNAVKATNYNLRLNILTDRVSVGNEYLTDGTEALIRGRVLDYGMRGQKRIEDAFNIVTEQNKFHPVQEYLESLVWDGRDYFSELMDYLYMEGNNAIFWRKWLIGAISKAYTGEQNYMITLLGTQGVGKSSLVSWLCPIRELHIESPIQPENKDYMIKLLNTWIWEVAELDSTTRKSDVSALKHFVSTQSVNVRLPYGKREITKNALASMIGTVNPDGGGYLVDTTSNRRFVSIEMNELDWRYSKMDVNQLWAQMYVVYKGGETSKLTQAEKNAQNEINEDYTQSLLIDDFIDENFKFGVEDAFMTTVGMLRVLENRGLKGSQYMSKKDLDKAMGSRNILKTRKRINGQNLRGYVGVSVLPLQYEY